MVDGMGLIHVRPIVGGVGSMTVLMMQATRREMAHAASSAAGSLGSEVAHRVCHLGALRRAALRRLQPGGRGARLRRAHAAVEQRGCPREKVCKLLDSDYTQ